MTKKAILLIEGSYFYYDHESPYAQEFFRLWELPTSSWMLESEVLSRLDSGEVYKQNVKANLNSQMIVVSLQVDRSLGKHLSTERIKANYQEQKIDYLFKNQEVEKNLEFEFSAKHYLAVPCAAGSCLFALTKKIETTERSAVVFITSKNVWDFQAKPKDQAFYYQYESKDLDGFSLQGVELETSLLKAYEQDASLLQNDSSSNFYLSKHFNIPYLIIEGHQKMQINHLKKVDS